MKVFFAPDHQIVFFSRNYRFQCDRVDLTNFLIEKKLISPVKNSFDGDFYTKETLTLFLHFWKEKYLFSFKELKKFTKGKLKWQKTKKKF